jgi:carboxylate-amine ligase
MMAELRYPARRTVVWGMHVHVAVGGADKALAVVEALIPDLPLLLALSASSPFWCGEETGLASTRLIVGQSMPRTGLPPAFETYQEFDTALGRLQRAGAIADATYLWWDVRLAPRLGTIEVRIMDAQPRVEDSAAIAGLIQALVRHYGKRYDRGEGFPRAPRFIVAENRWLAARHGLRAPLVADGDETVPARTLVIELLGRIAADAEPLGNGWALERVAEIAGDGSSAERQVELFRRGRTLPEIVRELAAETAL